VHTARLLIVLVLLRSLVKEKVTELSTPRLLAIKPVNLIADKGVDDRIITKPRKGFFHENKYFSRDRNPSKSSV